MASNGSLLSPSERSGDTALSALRPVLDPLTRAAQIVLRRRFRVLLLLRTAYERMTTHQTVLAAVRDDLTTVLRLLFAWTARSYERVPWAALVLMAAAVLYFVLPFDLIPDALAGIGFVDDIGVITTVVQAVRTELDRFREWDAQQ